MQLKNATYERFAQLISEGKSGVDAYIDAGHEVSRKVAGVSASRLLKNPDIKARIAELLAKRAEIELKATERATEAAVAKLAVTKERTLEELAMIAYALPAELKGWGDIGPRHLQAKLGALDKLGRHQGLFKDIVEHTGKDGAPLMPEASSRDVARAVLDILRTADVNGEAKGR